MSLPRFPRLLQPFSLPKWRSRAYSSLTTKLPYNFFSIFTMTTMASTTQTSPFPCTPYAPKHATWPYTAADFTRYDDAPDSAFYASPRLVTHIDDAAISRLTQYYAVVLPHKGTILDLCTSWKSFYPPTITSSEDLEILGVGLNKEEMSRNEVLDKWAVLDLNRTPDVRRALWVRGRRRWEGEGEGVGVGVEGTEGGQLKFDAITCAVSIDYLIHPLQLCRNLLSATNPGGTIHLVISNRCFPNKVVRRWMVLDERQRLEFVGDYLHFAGWKDVQIVDLCASDELGERVTDLDPLWVVRATKITGE